MTVDQAREIARERYGLATAFRVGMVMGEAGAGDAPNPFTAGSNRARLYANGVEWGEVEALRRRRHDDGVPLP